MRAWAGTIFTDAPVHSKFKPPFLHPVPQWTHSVKLKTYIVEDNATIRENLIGTLEELAFVEPVGVAETEDEGKHWLTTHPVQWDLAIVDLFLRQGSGLGVLAACQKRLPHQRMVVLSNYATPDVRMRCAQLGVDAVFDKSNEIDALIDYCIAQGNSLPESR